MSNDPTKPPTGSLAYKLNRLFETLHPGHRGEYTLQEVIDGIHQRGGPTLSMTYLWQLRHGVRDNPTKQHLEALADFFGVNPAYFFDAAAADRIDAQLDLLAAMRDADVRDLALRASELTPDGIRAIASVIDHIRLAERGQLGTGSTNTQATPTGETRPASRKEEGGSDVA